MIFAFWALTVGIAFLLGLVLGALATEYGQRPPRPSDEPDLRVVE